MAKFNRVIRVKVEVKNNPLAQALSNRLFHSRVKPSAKLYRRKPRSQKWA